MFRFYPARPLAAVGRVLGDLAAVVWSAAWGLTGYLVYKTVLALNVIADGVAGTGHTFNSWIAAFRSVTPRGIPGLSSFLMDQANALQRSSGDPLIAAGAGIHEKIVQMATTLGLVVALPPIVLGLGSYAIWRWRDAREMGAAAAFVERARATGRTEQARAVLAYRAVATLPFRQLMKASPDPVGDLARRDYERLASQMLVRSGLGAGSLLPPAERVLRE